MNPIKVLWEAARSDRTGLERFTDVNEAMIKKAYNFLPCAYGPEWRTDIAKLFWGHLPAPEADAYTAGGLSLCWFLIKKNQLLAKVVIFVFLSFVLVSMVQCFECLLFGSCGSALGTIALEILFWYCFF